MALRCRTTFAAARISPWPENHRMLFVTYDKPPEDWKQLDAYLEACRAALRPYGLLVLNTGRLRNARGQIHIKFQTMRYAGYAQLPRGRRTDSLVIVLKKNWRVAGTIKRATLLHEVGHTVGLTHYPTGIMAERAAARRPTFQGDPAEQQLIRMYGRT